MTARLFVAVWPDDAARDALADTVERARQAAPDVRWQPPERWHITLAFLGVADPGRAAARISTVERRGDTPAAEPIHLVGAGAFGPVVWVGVEHGAWLADLARRAATRPPRGRPAVPGPRDRGATARRRWSGAGTRGGSVALRRTAAPPWTPSADHAGRVRDRSGARVPHPRAMAAEPATPTGHGRCPRVDTATPPSARLEDARALEEP